VTRLRHCEEATEIHTGKGELIGWVVNCCDCGIPVHVFMTVKGKYIKDDDGEVIGWTVPCRDCGTTVDFYKPSGGSKFVPTPESRCEVCYEAYCRKKMGKGDYN